MIQRLIYTLLLVLLYAATHAQFAVLSGHDNQNVGRCIYNLETNTVSFLPYVDSVNTCGVWFNFGVAGYRKDTTLTFVSQFEKSVYSAIRPAVSFDNIHFSTIKQSERYNKFMLSIPAPLPDSVFIAAGYPYSYTHLQNFLDSCSNNKFFSDEVLHTTESGLNVHLLTITSPRHKRKKKLIWILGRQHAFECVSSYVVEGMIRYLLSDTCNKKLIDNYIFKIVPMIDVQNVWNGQSGRMSLPVDFNRDWNSRQREEIRIIEDEIKSTATKYSYNMFWDIHGTFPGGYCGTSFSYFDLYNNGHKHNDLATYWRFFKHYAHFAPSFIRDSMDTYGGMTSDWWNELNFPELRFSTTLEMDWVTSPLGKAYSPKDYLDIGAWMMMALIHM
jgi:hypothetical protein